MENIKFFIEKTGVIAALAAITFLLFTNNTKVTLVLFGVSIILVIPFVIFMKKNTVRLNIIKSLIYFGIFTFIIHILTNHTGKIWFKYHFIIISYDGVISGVFIVVKIITIYILSLPIQFEKIAKLKFVGKYGIIISCTISVLPKVLGNMRKEKNFTKVFTKVYRTVLKEYKTQSIL